MPINGVLTELIQFISLHKIVDIMSMIFVNTFGLFSIFGLLIGCIFGFMLLPWILHSKDWQFTNTFFYLAHKMATPIICGFFAYMISYKLKLNFDIIKTFSTTAPYFFKTEFLTLIGYSWSIQGIVIIYKTILKTNDCEKE